jgi:hypothetical protein
LTREKRSSSSSAGSGGSLALSNNLFWGTSVSLYTFGSTLIGAHDNAFDNCTIASTQVENSHNGYINCSATLSPSGASNVILTSFAYGTGPLGNYYQVSTNFSDMGSVANAALVGLYHYTTTSEQLKEVMSPLDIGFHYVTLGTNGLPVDTDGDGLADYWEDANGNSAYDASDPCSWGNPDTDGDGVTDFYEVRMGYDPKNAHTGGTAASDGDKDYDGDLLSNAAELSHYGSNPTNAHYFSLYLTDGEYVTTGRTDGASGVFLYGPPPVGGRIAFEIWYAPAGSTWDICMRPDLNPGTKWRRYYSGSPGQTTLIAPEASGMAFFRALLASDRDGDGLGDGYEALVSKTKIDWHLSDGDILPDGWEVEYGLDPTKPVAADDPQHPDADGNYGNTDNDTLVNQDELTAGTDPKRNNSSQQRPVITIAATDPTATEGGGDTARFTATRTGATPDALTVYYTLGGKATYGSDYTLTPTPSGSYPTTFVVTVPGGGNSSFATITVTPVVDSLVEGTEKVIVALAPSPTDVYVVDPNHDRATVSIRDSYCHLYTSVADFDQGRMFGVNHDSPSPNQDQLQLNSSLVNPYNNSAGQYSYINVACSGRGTVARIDVGSGAVIGEYWTSPDGRGRDPSRTTVDQFGNVWVANRAEGSAQDPHGSITRIGLVIGGIRCNADGSTQGGTLQYLKPPPGGFPYCTAIDRDGDGYIKTSKELGNILSWPGGADTVSSADDELITEYVRVNSYGTRTIAVDKYNDIWVGGKENFVHEKVDGMTSRLVSGTMFTASCGGYGGVIDQQGVLWSATDKDPHLLRLVPNAGNPPGNWSCLTDTAYGNYGIAVAPNNAPTFQSGYIWHTHQGDGWPGQVARVRPDGTLEGNYGTGLDSAQGVVVDGNGHVWVAHGQNDWRRRVGHLNSTGTLLGTVDLDPVSQGNIGPTGLSVDSNGKIWAGCFNDNSAMRINPALGTAGQVDLRVPLGTASSHPSGLDASPYNYSDMTGFNTHIVNPALQPYKGYWIVVDDSGRPNMVWEKVTWPAPATGRIEVSVRAAEARLDLYSQPFQAAANGGPLTGVKGRFLEVRAALIRDSLTGNPTPNPILTELQVCGSTATLSIDSQPGDADNIPEGGTATFTVLASGTDPLTYQWYHGGTALADDDWITGSHSSTLSVADVHCLEKGSYHVRVQEDPSGSAEQSRDAMLTMDAGTITIKNGRLGTVPYPAKIRVSGLAHSPMTAVVATLYDLSHNKPANLAVLLVSPTGQSVMLMSNVGDNNYPIPENASVDLTFADGDHPMLPQGPGAQIQTGTFKPSPYEPVPTMPAEGADPPPPPPPTGYGTTMSALNGQDPNGFWKLYVYDSSGNSSPWGQIAGSWCLSISQ